MALCRAVGLTVKITKPVLVNPCFIIPSSVNLQVRHAARKGYREKANKKKKDQKLEKAALPKEMSKVRTKLIKLEKTLNLDKPEPPDDDVFIRDNFNYKKYLLPEVIGFHREYHHPTVHNNPNSPVSLKIEINMTAKKKTQFLKPFSGVAAIPHPFVLKNKKAVLVFCSPEDREFALKCGAEVAGGSELIKKIQEGMVQPSLYDYIICHTNFFPQLTPIRGLLKDKFPKAKSGTLTSNLEQSIYRYLYGIEYSCVKYGASEDFGVIQCAIGTMNMETEQIEGNFKALLEDIEKKRPPRDGDFISWIWCTSPPSPEEFSIDLSNYLKDSVADVDDGDDDEIQLSEEHQEKAEVDKLSREYQEKEAMG